eukprot:30943-Pelagococcus_subviridis.AAC.17
MRSSPSSDECDARRVGSSSASIDDRGGDGDRSGTNNRGAASPRAGCGVRNNATRPNPLGARDAEREVDPRGESSRDDVGFERGAVLRHKIFGGVAPARHLQVAQADVLGVRALKHARVVVKLRDALVRGPLEHARDRPRVLVRDEVLTHHAHRELGEAVVRDVVIGVLERVIELRVALAQPPLRLREVAPASERGRRGRGRGGGGGGGGGTRLVGRLIRVVHEVDDPRDDGVERAVAARPTRARVQLEKVVQVAQHAGAPRDRRLPHGVGVGTGGRGAPKGGPRRRDANDRAPRRAFDPRVSRVQPAVRREREPARHTNCRDDSRSSARGECRSSARRSTRDGGAAETARRKNFDASSGPGDGATSAATTPEQVERAASSSARFIASGVAREGRATAGANARSRAAAASGLSAAASWGGARYASTPGQSKDWWSNNATTPSPSPSSPSSALSSARYAANERVGAASAELASGAAASAAAPPSSPSLHADADTSVGIPPSGDSSFTSSNLAAPWLVTCVITTPGGSSGVSTARKLVVDYSRLLLSVVVDLEVRGVLYKRTSGWSSKASGGVERRRGRGLKARDERRDATGKVLKDRRPPRRRGRMGTSA